MIKVNKYLPITILYMFFNSILLPIGLQFTNLLSPYFYSKFSSLHLVKSIFIFFAFLTPFTFIHFYNGVNEFYYVRTTIFLFTTYIAAYAFSLILNKKIPWASIFKTIIIFNFLLTLIALAAFKTNYKLYFWSVNAISAGMESFPRLSMFTYEPSYYSTLFVPIVVFLFLSVLYKFNFTNLGYLVLVAFSLLLSFSMGILMGIVIAIALFYLFNIHLFFTQKRYFISVGSILLLSILAIVFLFVVIPENPLTQRLVNIFSGGDSSANGRIYESYYLAWEIAKLKSVWFGVGLGQIKDIGGPIIRAFYAFPDDAYVQIPCVMAEVLGSFGIIGFALRIAIQLYLFVVCKVYNNHFKFILFLYIFIYQFTGSYLMNLAEIVIWVLVYFSNFHQFDRKNNLLKV